MGNEWFGEFDNFPASSAERPRIVFVYVSDLAVFQPILVDQLTGKRVPFTKLRFDTFDVADTNLTGQVVFRDTESGNPDGFHAVFDVRVKVE